jgi:hypothetical protein
MQRTLIAAATVSATLLVMTAAAFGAAPKPGGVYVGDIKSLPFTMHVNIGVNSKGTGAHFTYLCGTGRPPTTIFNLAIDTTGHFKFKSNPASGQAWTMAGHFVTPTTAFVSLNSISCGGSKGSITLKLK